MITNCCPAAATLPDTIAESCAQNFGQIQKIIFQRLYDGSTRNKFTASGESETPAGDATLFATWSAEKAATKTVGSSTEPNGARITVTPFIEAPADDGGDARTYGDGSNDTLNGAGIIIGSNPVNFTCRLNGKKQDIVANLQKLMCEALSNNLGVYLVNENGNIEGIAEPGTGTAVDWYPIPIQKLFVSDKLHGNWDGPDYNNLSFSFAPGYSDKLDVLVLDASALAL